MEEKTKSITPMKQTKKAVKQVKATVQDLKIEKGAIKNLLAKTGGTQVSTIWRANCNIPRPIQVTIELFHHIRGINHINRCHTNGVISVNKTFFFKP